MEIKEGGFEVTGLPVITRIQVQADDGGFRVIYAGQAYAPDEWREFVEAAVYVRDRLANAGMAPASTASGPDGPWRRLQDVPEGIDKVFDKDGDTWVRGEYGQWPDADQWAPFTVLKRA